MVSSNHEAMHRIFREDPGVFARMFRTLGHSFAGEPTSASLLPTDCTEIEPVDRRLDTLMQIDQADGSSFLLAVEAQGRRDYEKPASWAYYLAYLLAKHKKPPVLLVVCQDARTARWAEGPLKIGVAEWTSMTIHPFVLGPHNVPVIDDPAVAAEDVPLATFSAITHSNHGDTSAILNALATALKALDDQTASTFMTLTECGLNGTPAGELWRNLMTLDLSYLHSPSLLQAQAEGKAKGKAEGILSILDARGIALSDDERSQIAACRDLQLLDKWLIRALTTDTAAELLAESKDA